jgi:hypothetical protein
VVPADEFLGKFLFMETQIKKSKQTFNFTQVPNEILLNPDLRVTTKGVLCCLLSLPDDWVIYKKDLIKRFNLTRYELDVAFKELIQKGYILETDLLKRDGKFTGNGYIVYDKPVITDAEIQQRIESTDAETRHRTDAEIRHSTDAEIQHLLIHNNTNTNNTNIYDAKNEFLHTDINLENETTTDPKTLYLKENQDKTSSAPRLPKPPAKDWLPGEPLPTNFGQWTSQMFIQSINEAKKPEHSRELLNTFYNYWTQKDKSGRYGFQIEKKWSTALRLATFYRNETTGKFDQPNYKPSFPKTT